MDLFNEILESIEANIKKIKNTDGFAIIASNGDMVNPTYDDGYDKGFRPEWIWTKEELDNAVDVMTWMEERFGNGKSYFIVPCSEVGKSIFW